MRKPSKNKGFTLIEILLVVVIIGIMLAVIVPRAWRANVDTKYNLVRQNCNELASFGMEWVEQQVQAQPEDYGITQNDYLRSLANTDAWIPSAAYNWRQPNAVTHAAPVFSLTPQAAVIGVVPPDKHPRNPFNGVSYFESPNNPALAAKPVAGAIGCARATETPAPQYTYYAFMWQGTGSVSTTWTNEGTWYGGQKQYAIPPRIEGLRNGVFFARAR